MAVREKLEKEKKWKTYSCISDEEIKAMLMAEKISKINPAVSRIKIGQDVIIAEGSFKGSMVRVCSLPSKDRVGVLLSFLGSTRRVNIPKKNLIF